jgi:predicted negative regulator of RcsB-dependent stress response
MQGGFAKNADSIPRGRNVANKYTRKSKNPIPQSDEFVSFWQRAYEYISPYGRPIAIVGGALVVLLAVVWTTDRFYVVRKQNSTEMLGRVLRIYQAELLAPEANAEAKPEEAKPKDADVPRFKTAKERAEATLAELDKLVKEVGSSSAAESAQLVRAGALFDVGRYADAEAAYRSFIDQVSKSDKLALVAREGIGLSMEAQGKLDAALTTYQEIEKAGGDAYRDRAQFAQARVIAKKGDKKKAFDMYKQILDKSPTTPLREEIQAKQAQLAS